MGPKQVTPTPVNRPPLHIATAMRHMLKQRSRAIAIRDRASKEVESLDAALLALGWTEQLTLTAE